MYQNIIAILICTFNACMQNLTTICIKFCVQSTLSIECDLHYNMHCGFGFKKDEVMEMDFQAYLASADEECSNDEKWPDTGEGNKSLTEEKKIDNYRVRVSITNIFIYLNHNLYTLYVCQTHKCHWLYAGFMSPSDT